MKKITVPKGWRRLKKGTKIKEGDKFWCASSYWAFSTGSLNGNVGEASNQFGESITYIRRKSLHTK